MSFETHAGRMSPQEISKLMEVINLYATGKLMKAKSGIPETHQVDDLKTNNDSWKDYLEEV